MSHSIPLPSCSSQWVLSAFADEAGAICAQQVAALQRAGIKHVDLRGVDGFNIAVLPVDKARDIHRQLEAAGIRVAMLGSPLGKVDITEDFQGELDKLDHLGQLAEVFGCRAVRIFSYYNRTKVPGDQWERGALERLLGLRQRAARLNLTLYHENELNIFGDRADHVVKIAHRLRDPEGKHGEGALGGSFRLIFDFDNYHQAGEDVWACWLKLRDLTDGFHLKDSDKQNQHVPAGEGAGRVREILADALARSWHGPLSLEPHLAHSAAVMATGPSGQANQKLADMGAAEVFQLAAAAAKALLGQIKAPVV